MKQQNRSDIKLFESKQIRTAWNDADEKWYFVVSDVVQVLTDTPNPSDYIKKMRKRDEELSKGWGQIVTTLLVDTAGGKQKLNCAHAQGLLRINPSIPSPNAEPFKLWLAQVGSLFTGNKAGESIEGREKEIALCDPQPA